MLSMTIEDGSGTVLPPPAVKLPFVPDVDRSKPPLSSVKGAVETRGVASVTGPIWLPSVSVAKALLMISRISDAGRATAARIGENVRILVVKRIRQRSHRHD
jgi:hypothetical protein